MLSSGYVYYRSPNIPIPGSQLHNLRHLPNLAELAHTARTPPSCLYHQTIRLDLKDIQEVRVRFVVELFGTSPDGLK